MRRPLSESRRTREGIIVPVVMGEPFQARPEKPPPSPETQAARLRLADSVWRARIAAGWTPEMMEGE